MRFIFLWTMMFGAVLTGLAGANSPATTDSLTRLPLYPSVRNSADPGKPIKLPEANICDCKMQADFYNVYGAKVEETLAWCVANLPGFKHVHAYANGSSQDAFYNAEGTFLVSVMGTAAKTAKTPQPSPLVTRNSRRA